MVASSNRRQPSGERRDWLPPPHCGSRFDRPGRPSARSGKRALTRVPVPGGLSGPSEYLVIVARRTPEAHRAEHLNRPSGRFPGYEVLARSGANPVQITWPGHAALTRS
jgi:hypothetical protein